MCSAHTGSAEVSRSEGHKELGVSVLDLVEKAPREKQMTFGKGELDPGDYMGGNRIICECLGVVLTSTSW